jgi:hypothetical protein
MDLTGGCLCGAVRYRLSGAPRQVVHCHCSMCRRAGGAPVVTWATLPARAFAVEKGTLARYVSSAKASRQFCANCGAQITFQFAARPEEIDVTVGTLDDPSALPAQEHVWYADHIGWLTVDPALPVRKSD